ncbi:hypothetical protein QWY93_02735 [Echinicola jeungdonensis]|uniref:EH domain-containing protein n=1 Tax=Echinicola jeungdonensis TaxID=709343 RepID=A0ABV5J2C5_9BACT|nr:hypothetical protein [Echinicola jeungdonensis]MDN3668245.1 hypothetical protein [Echinicola jeungdonensis]
MIYDSSVWKIELKKDLEEIRDFFKETDLNYDLEFEENDDSEQEESEILTIAFIKLQKFAIYSSIILRKLIEARKLSDELIGKNYPIKTFSKQSDEPISIFNGYEIEKLYELNNPTTKNISIKMIAHRLIHSYHFMPKYSWIKIDESLPDEDAENWEVQNLEGVWFSSDKTKDSELSFIEIDIYFKIIEDVINDFIVHIEYNGDGQIVKKSSVGINEKL